MLHFATQKQCLSGILLQSVYDASIPIFILKNSYEALNMMTYSKWNLLFCSNWNNFFNSCYSCALVKCWCRCYFWGCFCCCLVHGTAHICACSTIFRRKYYYFIKYKILIHVKYSQRRRLKNSTLIFKCAYYNFNYFIKQIVINDSIVFHLKPNIYHWWCVRAKKQYALYIAAAAAAAHIHANHKNYYS